MEEQCKFSLQHLQLKQWLPLQWDADPHLECQEALQDEAEVTDEGKLFASNSNWSINI